MKITTRTLSVCVLLAIAFGSSTLITSSSFAASSSHHHRHMYTSATTIGPTSLGSVHCVFGCPLGNNIMGVVVHQLINYFLWSYP
jgi:hypothetical protein